MPTRPGSLLDPGMSTGKNYNRDFVRQFRSCSSSDKAARNASCDPYPPVFRAILAESGTSRGARGMTMICIQRTGAACEGGPNLCRAKCFIQRGKPVRPNRAGRSHGSESRAIKKMIHDARVQLALNVRLLLNAIFFGPRGGKYFNAVVDGVLRSSRNKRISFRGNRVTAANRATTLASAKPARRIA